MVKERPNEVPNLKALATGRSRKWDARLTPETTWALWQTEKGKAQWIAHVAVLEGGEVLSATTPKKDAVREFTAQPCIGFVGVVWANNEKTSVQVFTKQLRVSRDAEARLDEVVRSLGKRLEDGISTYGA